MKGLAGVLRLGQEKKTRLVSSETKLYYKTSIAYFLSVKFSIKEKDFLVEFPRKIVVCDCMIVI